MKHFLWILGGGAMQKFVHDTARSMGFHTIVSDRNENCLLSRFEIPDVFLPIDPGDDGIHKAELEKMLQSGWNIQGVVACGIDTPVTASVMQQALGKPAASPEEAYVCHRKDKLRGIIGGCSSITTDGSGLTIQELMERLGPMVIVKNTDSSGSRGVSRLNLEMTTQEQLDNAVREAIAASRSRRALIEQLLKGTEHTVEAIYDIEGKFRPCFITDRFFNFGPHDKEYVDAYSEAIELGLGHPTSLTTEQQALCYVAAKLAAEKVGISRGTVKCDIMMTADGPAILEMTTRSSGGFDVQFLVPKATGKNIMKAIIDTACGNLIDPEDLKPKWQKYGMSSTLWLPEGRKVQRITLSGVDLHGELIHTDDDQDEVQWMMWWKVKPGDIVPGIRSCADRPNILMAVRESPIAASIQLQRFEQAIEVTYE